MTNIVEATIRADLKRWDNPNKLCNREGGQDYGPYISDFLTYKCPLIKKFRACIVSKTGAYWTLPCWTEGGALHLYSPTVNNDYLVELKEEPWQITAQVKEAVIWSACSGLMYWVNNHPDLDMQHQSRDGFSSHGMNHGSNSFIQDRLEVVRCWTEWAAKNNVEDPLRAFERTARAARQRHLRASYNRAWRNKKELLEVS